MNRRKFIVGLSAAALGSSATLGTGAFTSAQVNRAANISVVDDSQGLIGLIPNDDVAGVSEGDNGQLSISMTDPGINVNSIYQFGHLMQNYSSETPEWFTLETTDDPIKSGTDGFESAFLVTNQANSTIDITFTLDPTSSSSDAGGTKFVFEIHDSDKKISDIRYPNQTANPSLTLRSGEAFGVSFFVNAIGGHVDDSFTASIEIDAMASSS